MYRQEDTNWIDRWERVTGTRPDDNLRKPKSLNNKGDGRSVAGDATRGESPSFRNKPLTPVRGL